MINISISNFRRCSTIFVLKSKYHDKATGILPENATFPIVWESKLLSSKFPFKGFSPSYLN